MRMPTCEHLLPMWIFLSTAGERWAGASVAHGGVGMAGQPSSAIAAYLAHRLLATVLQNRCSLAWGGFCLPRSKHPSLGLWQMVFPYGNLTDVALIWDISDNRKVAGGDIWGCLRNPRHTRSKIFFPPFAESGFHLRKSKP